jgi:hypothetical protein
VPEETTPPEGTPSTPSIDWDSPDNPYVKRFQDTQSAYTTNQQELARLKAFEQDPQAYLELGRQQGWIEIEEPAAEPEPGVDPRVAQLEQQNAELMTWREQVEADRQAQRVAEGEQQFQSDLDGWAKQEGLQLSKWDRMAILQQTLAAEEPGPDAAKAAFDAFAEDARSNQPRPRVPTPPSGGQPNTGTPKWGEMSQGEIDEYMAQRVAGNV